MNFEIIHLIKKWINVYQTKCIIFSNLINNKIYFILNIKIYKIYVFIGFGWYYMLKLNFGYYSALVDFSILPLSWRQNLFYHFRFKSLILLLGTNRLMPLTYHKIQIHSSSYILWITAKCIIQLFVKNAYSVNYIVRPRFLLFNGMFTKPNHYNLINF